MKKLFEALCARLEAGKNTMLVTVVESRGSTPGKPGARMLADETGHIAGTVGGGAIEYQAVRTATEEMRAPGCFTRKYTLNNTDAGLLGMVCGGTAFLLFQRLTPEDAAICRAALCALDGERDAFFCTDLSTGEMRVIPALPDHPEGTFVQRLNAEGTVFVFGGGHVAQALVPLLKQAGFRAIVLDDRRTFADAALFPDAAETRVVDFAAMEPMTFRPQDSVVIMTRGHQFDRHVLEMALMTPAGYVGMIGSRAKCRQTTDALRAKGFDDAAVARVRSPIGIPIQAETPFEIAVSVVAELILSRAERRK